MVEQDDTQLQECPECKQQTLHYDPYYKLYECKNDQCKRLFNQKDFDRKKGIDLDAKREAVTQKEHAIAYSPITSYKSSPTSVDYIKKHLYIIIAGIIAAAAIFIFFIYSLLSPPLKTPTSFTVKAGNGRNTISWVNDASADGVIVVYDSLNYPVSIDDGTLLYSGSGAGYIHDDLEYNDMVYYSIWSFRLASGEKQYSEAFKSATGTPYWSGLAGEAITEYVEYSEDGDNYRVVGADGGLIQLVNNPEADKPTWAALKQFLFDDETDKVIYEDDVFVCADFAEMLHNNAEEAGIRTGYVVISFLGEEVGHACNAVNTTDEGLVFIDCNGTETGDVNADREVEISIGAQYIPTAIFPAIGSAWLSMGEVEEFWVVW